MLDAWGRQLPSTARFPSAADGRGFTRLARTVHDLGLKFGVHVMRGVPRAAVEQRLPVHGTQWTCDEIADADMLPLGRLAVRAHVGLERDSALTLEEQRTMISLWCIARSPLMLGGHLPRSREDTLALLTNDAILALLTSDRAREIVRDDDLVIWTADHDDAPVDDQRSVAVFWLGERPTRHVVRRTDVGLGAGGVRDLWHGRVLDAADLELDIPAHGVRVLRGRRR